MRAEGFAELDPERQELVLELLTMPADLPPTRDSLARFPWDSDAAVEFEPTMLRAALESTLGGTRTIADLYVWADVIEMREDIQMTDERVREITHVLANPDLEGATDSARLRDWIAALGTDNP